MAASANPEGFARGSEWDLVSERTQHAYPFPWQQALVHGKRQPLATLHHTGCENRSSSVSIISSGTSISRPVRRALARYVKRRACTFHRARAMSPPRPRREETGSRTPRPPALRGRPAAGRVLEETTGGRGRNGPTALPRPAPCRGLRQHGTRLAFHPDRAVAAAPPRRCRGPRRREVADQ